MTETKVTSVTPSELINLIIKEIKQQLENYSLKIDSSKLKPNKPHLTRKETAEFFNVSMNCINDWCKKGILTPLKVGQRTYFSREEVLRVLFKNLENAQNKTR